MAIQNFCLCVTQNWEKKTHAQIASLKKKSCTASLYRSMSNYTQRVAVAKGQEKIIFLAFITWKIRSHMRSTSKCIQNKLYCSILNILRCKNYTAIST